MQTITHRSTTFFDRSRAAALTDRRVSHRVDDPDGRAPALGHDLVARPLVMDQVADRPSLVEFELAPGAAVPRHHHDTDQIVLVLAGELRQGRRSIGEGEGFYTPAGVDYAIAAGPRGCTFVEFRPVSRFTTSYGGRRDVVQERP